MRKMERLEESKKNDIKRQQKVKEQMVQKTMKEKEDNIMAQKRMNDDKRHQRQLTLERVQQKNEKKR